MNVEDGPAGRPWAAAPGLRLRGLAKSFGAVQAVHDLNLDIAPGETVALLGLNGAGKSTTISMITGLLRPDRGAVSVLGGSVAGAVKAGRIGVMLQSDGLLRDLSVRELLTMAAGLYPAPLDVSEALGLAGVRSLADLRTQRLSGGQAQRVRFALALVPDPDLLILDEPTVGMDVAARQVFWAATRAFAARHRTVLFATHYLEEAGAHADRIVLLSGGRVVADGSATQIKATAGRRTIRATLPDPAIDTLTALPGVVRAERHGASVTLVCGDSDIALRALLRTEPAARDIEVLGANLEQAYVELTEQGKPR
ncbi:ABC transporter ATP-binding protein [Actinomadura sp. KC216]|nr:ABC transporter ATP-binding protein [Actinomadura sp. KC216]